MFASGVNTIIDQEMVKERDKLEETITAMEKNLTKARATQDTTAEEDTLEKSYKRWDCYQDIDELEAKIDVARRDLSKLNEKILAQNNSGNSGKHCNHRYSCSCQGDKSAERKVVEMTTSERLEQMALFKKEGNDLYAQKKYKDAAAFYEQSLIYYEYCFLDGNDDELMQAAKLRLQASLNLAACFLHLNLYPRCIDYYNEALEIDNSSTKAWFRRARAHRLQEKFDIAEKDLTKAIESLDMDSSPLSSDIHREMKLLKDDKRRYIESSTDLATSMMGGLNVGSDSRRS